MMRRRLVSSLVVTGALATTLSVPAVTASADSDVGPDFGQHVSDCAQPIGFDGTHNPGTHRGFTGWEPMDGC
jgi:hypothetical protein